MEGLENVDVAVVRAGHDHAQEVAHLAEITMRIEDALVSHRTSIGATLGRSGGCVLLLEPFEATVTGHALGTGTGEPAHEVGVV